MPPMVDITDKLPANLQPWGRIISFWADFYQLDPFILAGVMQCETQGGQAPGLDVQGPSGRGDGGHGHGLMQVDDRFHASMVACLLGDATRAWANPAFNVGFGASILADFLRHLAGDYPAAICAYNAGEGAARGALAGLPDDASIAARVAALDQVTATKRYVSDVLSHRTQFAGLGTP